MISMCSMEQRQFPSDSLFVNLDLVAGGWAVPYPFPPNTTYESEFASAANDARASSLGLWGKCSR